MPAQAATSIAAFGAAALDHSASRVASMSSAVTPGSEQLELPLGGAGWIVLNDPEVYLVKPNALRKVFQSVGS